MPPVLKVRQEETKVISQDTEIDQFETDGTKYVFSDITFGIPHRVGILLSIIFDILSGHLVS